jgi:hypothetical protein
MARERPGERRYRAENIRTAETDAIIMELVPKGKPLSAAVRIGCTSDEVLLRYTELMEGKKARKSRRSDGPLSDERREQIRRGLEQARLRRGETV